MAVSPAQAAIDSEAATAATAALLLTLTPAERQLSAEFDVCARKIKFVIAKARQSDALLGHFAQKLEDMKNTALEMAVANVPSSSNSPQLAGTQSARSPASAASSQRSSPAAVTRNAGPGQGAVGDGASAAANTAAATTPPIPKSKFAGMTRRERRLRAAEERKVRRDLAFAERKAKEKHLRLLKQQKVKESAMKVAAEQQRRELEQSLAKAVAEGKGAARAALRKKTARRSTGSPRAMLASPSNSTSPRGSASPTNTVAAKTLERLNHLGKLKKKVMAEHQEALDQRERDKQQKAREKAEAEKLAQERAATDLAAAVQKAAAQQAASKSETFNEPSRARSPPSQKESPIIRRPQAQQQQQQQQQRQQPPTSARIHRPVPRVAAQSNQAVSAEVPASESVSPSTTTEAEIAEPANTKQEDDHEDEVTPRQRLATEDLSALGIDLPPRRERNEEPSTSSNDSSVEEAARLRAEQQQEEADAAARRREAEAKATADREAAETAAAEKAAAEKAAREEAARAQAAREEAARAAEAERQRLEQQRAEAAREEERLRKEAERVAAEKVRSTDACRTITIVDVLPCLHL